MVGVEHLKAKPTICREPKKKEIFLWQPVTNAERER